MGIMSWLLGGGCEGLSPEEVKAMRARAEKFVMVDVRTPHEYATRRIEGSRHIPLQELEKRASEIPMDKDVVLYCQTGMRSIMACRMLKRLGFSRIKNMEGGISSW